MLYEVIKLVMLFISKRNNQKELFNMAKELIGTVDHMNTGRAELYAHSRAGHIEYHVFDVNNNMVCFGNGTPRQAGMQVEEALKKMI